jgi:hypothetical protein
MEVSQVFSCLVRSAPLYLKSNGTIFRAKVLNESAGMLNFAIIQPLIPYIIEINSYICKFNLGFMKLI